MGNEKQRKLFCEISPLTYKISVMKCRTIKHIRDFLSGSKFSRERTEEKLPVVIYRHKSLIRRRLGNVDMTLQENKATNLRIASGSLDGILIKPGETFSFWHLVGNPVAKRGYLEGLTIERGNPSKGVGGGMCQMTNLIHWMALHSDLTVTEHHHHDRFDLFPDFGRKVPFGTGTSVMYNYLDYRLTNNTDRTYQLLIYTDSEHLCGELRSDKDQTVSYHIKSENERFVREDGEVFRLGEVFRETVDIVTGNIVSRECIRKNHAKVMYDTSALTIEEG